MPKRKCEEDLSAATIALGGAVADVNEEEDTNTDADDAERASKAPPALAADAGPGAEEPGRACTSK